jgi:hypothetical protein
METFFTFAFGRLQSSKEFLDLFNSITDEKDIKTLQLMIIKTCGLEIDKFDNLTLALSQLKSSNSVFVYKTIDLIICESISDLKVKSILDLILILLFVCLFVCLFVRF